MLALFVALFCLCLGIWYKINRQKWAALDKVPGPMGIPFVGNILDINPDPKKSLDGLYALSQQYGGIFKMNLGPLGWTVLLSDPKYFEQIMTSNIHLLKGGWYTVLQDWIGFGMAISNGLQWKNARKLINPIFNTNVLSDFCQKFDRRNREFIEELKPMGENAFLINAFVHRNSFLQMFKTLIDDEVREDQLKTYLNCSKTIIKIATNRIFSLKIFDFIFNLSKDYTTMHDALKKVNAIIEDIMKIRRLTRKNVDIKSGQKTFLDLLLDIQDENPDIPDIHIIHQIDTFMFAGHDTVAGATSFAIYELSRNKEMQEKLFNESVKIFGSDLSAELTLHELENAEYLDMFCKEVLRMYPSGPMIARNIVEPLKLGEFDIPAGTNVMMLIYCMQRTPKYYPDPLKFNPDRFSPQNKHSRSEYAHSSFSHGPRNCIGQRYALAEIKSTISMLVRHFIFSKGDPNFEVSVGQSGTLSSLNGILVRLQERRQLLGIH